MFGLLLAALLAAPAGQCQVGAWRLHDGTPIDIAPAGEDRLRWRRVDGATGLLQPGGDGAWTSTLGWTGRSDGHRVRFGACDEGRLVFDDASATRIPLDITTTRFEGAGHTALAGRLVLPPGDGAVPIVVLVHGSEIDSALENDWMQRLLPAAGVGAFVYDKRGTGASAGSYTQDFSVLADDAVAAVAEARRLAGRRAGRVGFRGASQGGWVAPLAATRTAVDFVIVVFGLAVSPLEEDHEAVVFQMRARGHGDDVIRQALEVSDAAGALVASRFAEEKVKAFVAARARYRDAPWYADLRGNLTQVVLPIPDDALDDMTWLQWPMSPEELRERGPIQVVGTPFHYDSVPVLRKLETPQLWLLGERDEDAPSAETLRRLARLQAEGRPITTALFPDAVHGMTVVKTGASGEPEEPGYAPGYMRAILDFARDGRLQGGYGEARVSMPSPAAAREAAAR